MSNSADLAADAAFGCRGIIDCIRLIFYTCRGDKLAKHIVPDHSIIRSVAINFAGKIKAEISKGVAHAFAMPPIERIKLEPQV